MISIYLCAIPFNRLEELSRRVPRLQHWFHRLMSLKIIRDQKMMELLSGMWAEQRLAVSLLDLSGRLKSLAIRVLISAPDARGNWQLSRPHPGDRELPLFKLSGGGAHRRER